MRSGQIQSAIADGVSPFALCHLLTREVRSRHKSGDPIQRSIGSALQSLGSRAETATRMMPSHVGVPVAIAPPLELLPRPKNGGALLWPECF